MVPGATLAEVVWGDDGRVVRLEVVRVVEAVGDGTGGAVEQPVIRRSRATTRTRMISG